MFRIFIIFLFTFPFPSFSQLSIEELPDSELNLFHKDAAYQLGLTVARVEFSYKYDHRPIRNSKHYKIYNFGQGLLVGSSEVSVYPSWTDSLITEYVRDRSGNLIYLIETKSGTTSVLCRKIENDKITELAYYQMKKTRKWNDKLSPLNLIWCDSISHFSNQSITYNQYGLKQKEAHYKYDEKENLTSNSTYDQSGKVSSHHLYKYDDKGRLISAEETNMNKYLFNWKKTFEYDENDRLIRTDYFKDGKLHSFRKISYFPNGLPELDITRLELEYKLIIKEFNYFIE